MRRSSIIMLFAAIALGLVAVVLARYFLLPSEKPQAAPEAQTVAAVVAAQPFAFGEKITADKLKVVRWPAAGIPAGTFQRVTDAVGVDDRVALRKIETNELITVSSVSGKESRLSASQLLGATMRAVAVPINEASAAGGFIAPGDRVDVFLTRQQSGEELPYADLLVQNARVLAVGQDSNVAKDKPEVVRTATIEVSPLQAQKLALASNVGTLSLSLRNILDDSKVRLETVQLLDLNDGTVTRILRKPRMDTPAPARASTSDAPALPKGPYIEIFRRDKPTIYPVPSGS
jgi:pilus assembly protein CpaB